MAMLDAVRQASHILGVNPETFRNFSLNENKLTFRSPHIRSEDERGQHVSAATSHPEARPNMENIRKLVNTGYSGGESQRFVDNEFDLSDDRAVYRNVNEIVVNDGEEYSTGGFSPEAQRRVHGRDLLWRDNKWVPTPLDQGSA
jgi:hypothetical protein